MFIQEAPIYTKTIGILLLLTRVSSGQFHFYHPLRPVFS